MKYNINGNKDKIANLWKEDKTWKSNCLIQLNKMRTKKRLLTVVSKKSLVSWNDFYSFNYLLSTYDTYTRCSTKFPMSEGTREETTIKLERIKN